MCRPLTGDGHSIFLALFLSGAVGSLMHCAMMCSPFVLAQASTQRQSLWQRVLPSYHLGRIVTYALLGALAAFSFRTLLTQDAFYLFSRFLLAAAGCAFLASMFFRLPFSLPRSFGKASACAVAQLQSPLSSSNSMRRFFLGMMMGLIPCGLVFAALMAAAATGSAASGAMAMIAFGLGTTPVLMAISSGSTSFFRRHPKAGRHFTTAAMGMSGILLLVMARS